MTALCETADKWWLKSAD